MTKETRWKNNRILSAIMIQGYVFYYIPLIAFIKFIMDIILIAAITADGYIARHSREIVTWSRDLALFKEQTMGCPVILGSNTLATLAVELEGREKIVVHRDDEPQRILQSINAKRCFVIGGGRTYTRFAPFFTHLYLTPHPIIFGGGIPLFPGLKSGFNLKLEKKVLVDKYREIFQYQYVVVRERKM
jgi:dihydrofolate reductase